MNEKIKFGLKQYFRPTPAKVKRLLLFWKGIIATTAVIAYSEKGLLETIIVGVVGFVIAETLEFVGENPQLFATEQAKNVVKDMVTEAAEEIKEEQLKDKNQE